jgi:hypothetical protein
MGQVRRDGRERTVRGNRHIFSMSTKRAAEPDEPEYPVADRDRCDTGADRLDFSGELVPQDRPPWLDKPGEESREEGLARTEAAVRPVHGRRVNLDEQLVVLGHRLFTSDIRTTSGRPYLV